MRFEVPQFIEVEDKIFGPLTWRQFVYLGGGVGVAVVMFLTMPFLLFLFTGLPLAVLAGALSFYPINNRPFSFFLEAVFSYFKNQRLYLWRKKDQMVHKYTSAVTPVVTPAAMPNGSNNLHSLSRKLELAALQKQE